MRLLTLLLDRRTAPPRALALRHWAEYMAFRVYALIVSFFPIDINLRTGRMLGDLWWRLMPRHRQRAMEHLRMALGDCTSEADLERIARRSFQHFAQLYMVELVQTPRLINLWSWARYVELGNVGPALRELLCGRGAIMLTAHFGNFELMGYTIARLGIPLTAVMRPLDNERLNDFLVRSRAASGLTLLFKKGVTQHAQQVLERGGTLCFIADQNAGRKGYFVEFFGRKASTYKSIALLAMHYRVPVIVGSTTRVGRGFRYRMELDRIIRPEEWESREDAAFWLTEEYSRAMEAAIRRHPEQYLWVHRRWKTRPKDEQATADVTFNPP